jgi:hypothetical protein
MKIDSFLRTEQCKRNDRLPSTYAAGVTFHKTTTNSRGTFEMWSIGAEYTATNWTNYRFYNQADRLANSWQFKIGAQFCPDPLIGPWLLEQCKLPC